MNKTLLHLLSCCLIGCSAFRSANQPILITCAPFDTYVTINGDRVVPPATVAVRRDAKQVIVAQKEGFYPYTKTFDYHINNTGVMDAIGTCVWFFPCFGLLTPGAWSLDQTNVTIQMEDRTAK